MTKAIKVPNPDHPITLVKNANRVVVTVAGTPIADTTAALTLQEASYPPVQYIPRADVDMTALTRSATQSYCPYKGEASYFSIPAGGERSVDAVWSYEAPYDWVSDIKGYVAFYPDRVDLIEERRPRLGSD